MSEYAVRCAQSRMRPSRVAPLTAKQAALLDFIVDHAQEHGCPPTRWEMCHAFGWKSTYAATCHLLALVRKGRIEIDDMLGRGIRVVSPATSVTSRGFEGSSRRGDRFVFVAPARSPLDGVTYFPIFLAGAP